MATISIQGNEIHTAGELPKVGEQAPDFKLVKTDLSEVSLKDFQGKRVVLNIFPSIDTSVCATSVRNFNKKATGLKNTAVLCVSRDLPFAQKRFVNDEGLENVTNLSDFKTHQFGKDYGLEIIDGPFAGLLSRVVLVIDEDGQVIHSQQIPEISEEPNYLEALKTLL